MTYAVSDIHGCYKEFTALLEKINFCGDDDLYIIGDVVDRGPEPIKVLLDIMERPNVSMLFGNHEFMMHKVISQLGVEITEESIDRLSIDDINAYLLWMDNGGGTTCSQFMKQPESVRKDIMDYILDSDLYVDMELGGKRFILAHSGLHNFNGDLDALNLADFCMYRTDYTRRYFSDENTFLVTGHTPTPHIRGDCQPLVYEKYGHIAIDCGCVFGGKLAAYCFETGEITYEPSQPMKG